MTSVDYTFNFLCGRPHGVWPLPRPHASIWTWSPPLRVDVINGWLPNNVYRLLYSCSSTTESRLCLWWSRSVVFQSFWSKKLFLLVIARDPKFVKLRNPCIANEYFTNFLANVPFADSAWSSDNSSKITGLGGPSLKLCAGMEENDA